MQELLKLLFVPLESLFKVDNSRVLRQFGVLLFGFCLQKLQFFLNFIHVCREGKPEVVLVLAEHLYQLFVIVAQTVVNVVKLRFYFVEVGDQRVKKGVLLRPAFFESSRNFLLKVLENCNRYTK